MKTCLVLLLVAVSAISPMLSVADAQVSGGLTATLKNGTWTVPANKQVQIAADVTSGLDRDQPFAYIVQIVDQNDVVVQLSWLTGTLTAGQSLNPSQSWTPTVPGNYTAQIFVWSGINNPDALSAPLAMKITVT
ncbi:MAG: hypothetical protein KGI33_04515 [Thaumarchaeota archaeon]|nr:hypothetical protein [Nitrososphaerota archaeon]